MKQTNLKDYATPATMEEALKLLNNYEGNMRIVAGASDIFVSDNEDIDALCDISKLELAYIKKQSGKIIIGAGTTFNQIIQSEVLETECTGVCESAKRMADYSTRNLATIGGNLCSAVPSGDGIPVIVALEADLIIVSSTGERTINIKDFFVGPRKTVLKRGDILKEIHINTVPKSGSAFEKIARTSLDLAVVNAGAAVCVNDKGEISKVCVALGAVAPTVVRLPELEAALIGKKDIEKAFEGYKELVSKAISPIDNLRSTAEYRTDVSYILAKRTVIAAYDKAMKN